MHKRYVSILILLALLFFLSSTAITDAARRPDIVSYDAALLQNAIEVTVKWQSEYPVTRAQVTAGNKGREIELDPYDDNIKDSYGYHGEASLMVPVDSSGFYEDYISYVIQLEDDVGHRSRRVSGRLKVSSTVTQAGETEAADDLTREFIDREKKEQPEGMIDKVLKVMERHDTPPVITDITVNRPNARNVSFASQGIDDKGLKKITFKIFNAEGIIVQEQELSDLGKIWKGTTQTFTLEYGTYKVVAQATDTAGNTSPEESKEFKITAGAGSLTVSITPPAATAAGAQWRVDAGAWQMSGTKVPGIPIGAHSVEFKAVEGWTGPGNQAVTIEAGTTTGTTGTYSQERGSIAVTIVPQTAIEQGAQWRVDDGLWQNSGVTAAALSTGTHVIGFKSLQGWGTPGNQNVIVAANKTTAATGTYSQKAGSLTGAILPTEAIDAGAEWKVDDGPWQKSGITISGLSIGTHTVTFKTVTGWTGPGNQNVTIEAGKVATLTGTYSQAAGMVAVTIMPQAAVDAGAAWRVDKGAWQKGGTTVSGLSTGVHPLDFKAVVGWDNPPGQSLSIKSGETTSATGSYGRVYTLDRDFDEGRLVGLEHKTVANQLQLSTSSTTLPFIWVPNSNLGTISKVDTKTGKEMGRYRTGPSSQSTNPSRTTVDLQGNCWVGNRGTGTVVKVGLYENGQYEDRNGNGTIETSRDLNNDGVISDDETLDWGKDECVLLETVVIEGKEGNHRPGTYRDGYSSRPGPRGIAIDAQNNLWAGTFGNSKNKYYYINGTTGQVLKTVDVSPQNHRAYGAVIDRNGILWSSSLTNSLLKFNPANNVMKTIDVKHQTYGIALDRSNHLFVAGWGHNKLSRINILTDKVEWTVDTGSRTYPKGLTVDDNGDVWVAHYYEDAVVRWSNDGKKKATIKTGKQPSGVAIDARGKPWSVNYSDQYLKRIDPATNKVDLEILIKGNHYSYSDMTGIVARSMTTKIGTWTVVFNSKSPATPWGMITWKASTPPGTSLALKVRSSKDAKGWSSWEKVTQGKTLQKTPAGMYLEVETTMQISAGETSPVLHDLTVQVQ